MLILDNHIFLKNCHFFISLLLINRVYPTLTLETEFKKTKPKSNTRVLIDSPCVNVKSMQILEFNFSNCLKSFKIQEKTLKILFLDQEMYERKKKCAKLFLLIPSLLV